MVVSAFRDNPAAAVPAWLAVHKPKGHWFNADPDRGDFPGSEQVEEPWRWIEDLPSNKDNATPIATLRERAARLERITLQRDPAHWRSPGLSGEVHFPYKSAPSSTYRMGYGVHEFALKVSDRNTDMVAVYADPIKAVGLVRPRAATPEDWAAHLTPGRVVDARPGSTVVLMNEDGVLCRVEILIVQTEVSAPSYIAPYVDFRYEVITTA